MNLATLFADHPAERTAIVTGGDRITYGQLSAEVEKTRGVLVSLGLEPGDRVAILCATNFRFVRAWFGILGAGMVAVPLNPQSPAPEIERELAQVGAKAVIAGPAGIGVLEQVDRSVVPTLKHVLRPSGVGLPDSVDLDVLRETVEPAPMVERADGDLACLMFTSGTAGAPKAAMLTHGNLAANLRQNMATSGKVVRPDDVGLCVLPLFHIMGLNSILNLSLYAGATLVLQERFDPMTVFETIADEQISVLVGPPTMWAALSQVDLVADDALKTIRIAVSGAATLPNRVVKEVAGRFGVRILEGYGLTEAAPGVTRATVDDTPIGSIGRPMAGMEVRIVDAAGDDVYIGDEGEILVRGDNVFVGYLDDPEATARAIDPQGWLHTGDIAVVDDDGFVYIGDEGEILVRGDNVFVGYLDDPEATARAIDPQGWLHTGDVAVVDDDGFVYIVDRAKDLIIVSGFNVFPAEVEWVLNAHPGVVESGVVGVPHPHTGESVKAFIVAEPGRVLEEDDLIEWCATELARYKCPTKIDLVDEIPRGLGGKIIRRELGA